MVDKKTKAVPVKATTAVDSQKKPSDKKSADMKKLSDAFGKFKWKGLTEWEANSKVSATDWRNKIEENAKQVFEKFFAGTNKIDKWDDKSYDEFITTVKRRIYNTEYAAIAKQRQASSEYYKFLVLGVSEYNDWGNNKRKDLASMFVNYTQLQKDEKEGKEFRIIRDSNGQVTGVIPLVNDGKSGLRDVLEHEFMGTAICVGMSEKAIEEAQSANTELTPRPIVLSLNGNETGLKGSPGYVNLKPGKCYRMKCSIERGQKLGSGKDVTYAYEGSVEIEKTKDVDGNEIINKVYHGPKSYQDNLKVADVNSLKDGDKLYEEIPIKDMMVDEATLIDTAYDTWSINDTEDENGNNGLACLPMVFSRNHLTKKGIETSITPVSFSADVLEAKVQEPDEQNQLKRTMISLRLDDTLDEKNVMDGNDKFKEISLYPPAMDAKAIEDFKKLAPGSRITVIATITRKDAKKPLGGSFFHYKIDNSTAVTISEDMWKLEEGTEEKSVSEEKTVSDEIKDAVGDGSEGTEFDVKEEESDDDAGGN